MGSAALASSVIPAHIARLATSQQVPGSPGLPRWGARRVLQLGLRLGSLYKTSGYLAIEPHTQWVVRKGASGHGLFGALDAAGLACRRACTALPGMQAKDDAVSFFVVLRTRGPRRAGCVASL